MKNTYYNTYEKESYNFEVISLLFRINVIVDDNI